MLGSLIFHPQDWKGDFSVLLHGSGKTFSLLSKQLVNTDITNPEKQQRDEVNSYLKISYHVTDNSTREHSLSKVTVTFG